MYSDSPSWDLHWKEINKFLFFYERIQENQFKMYKKLIGNKISSNSKILELGGGSGILSSRLVNEYDCDSVIIDNSFKAKQIFEKKQPNKKINYKLMNAFELNEKNKYDLVFSDGLIEHFTGKKQEKLIEMHKSAVKDSGSIILVVPRKSKRYFILSNLMKFFGLWNFGFEKPFSLIELRGLCTKNGLMVHKDFKGIWEIAVICSKL